MIDEDVNLSTLLKDFETEKVTPPFSTKLIESAKTKQKTSTTCRNFVCTKNVSKDIKVVINIFLKCSQYLFIRCGHVVRDLKREAKTRCNFQF